jgi:hypothetical protein
MNKDDYAKMKVRQDIATSFIDKIDKIEMQDLDLLPALLKYVENGNLSAFEEYKQWHFYKTLEERLSDLHYKTEEAKVDFEKTKDTYDRVKEEYEKYADDYRKWREKFIKQIDTLGGCGVYLNEIIDFAKERNLDNLRRLLFVSVAGKLHAVQSVTMVNNHIVLSLHVDNIRFQTPPVFYK